MFLGLVEVGPPKIRKKSNGAFDVEIHVEDLQNAVVREIAQVSYQNSESN